MNDKTDELFRTAVGPDAESNSSQEREIFREVESESRIGMKRRILIDVGDDPAFDQLMNETRIPERLISDSSVSKYVKKYLICFYRFNLNF